MIDRVKAWARAIRRDVVALWIAARDRRTPWHAKAMAAAVAAYALSPIDLIPDVVPVLGYLDDLLLLPLGILLAVRMIPAGLMALFRRQAARMEGRPVSRAGLALVIGLWLLGGAAALWWLWPGAAATHG